MAVSAPQRMTFGEWLDWASKQETRSELIEGQPFAMSPERVGHGRSKAALFVALTDALRAAGLACEAIMDSVSVKIDDLHGFVPDALIYCGDKLPSETVVIDEPLVVFEVISPGSVARDTIMKLEGYFRVASIAHYVIVDPWEERVLVHSRSKRGEIITKSITTATFDLDPPGITLAPASFWDRD